MELLPWFGEYSLGGVLGSRRVIRGGGCNIRCKVVLQTSPVCRFGIVEDRSLPTILIKDMVTNKRGDENIYPVLCINRLKLCSYSINHTTTNGVDRIKGEGIPSNYIIVLVKEKSLSRIGCKIFPEKSLVIGKILNAIYQLKRPQK